MNEWRFATVAGVGYDQPYASVVLNQRINNARIYEWINKYEFKKKEL